MNVLKLRRASIYALLLSIILNFMAWALNLLVLSDLGLFLLGVYIFISIFFWRCPFCKKRLPMRFDAKNNVDEVICPYCKSNLLYDEKNK